MKQLKEFWLGENKAWAVPISNMENIIAAGFTKPILVREVFPNLDAAYLKLEDACISVLSSMEGHISLQAKNALMDLKKARE